MGDVEQPKLSMNRRMFLAMLGATGATAALAPRWFDLEALAADATPIDPAYPHGIAAGDPRPDGSVIWTRIDPGADTGGGVAVRWEVSDSETFATIVASGDLTATADTDHTISTTVTGLASDGWFHYRFRYETDGGTKQSRTGRLRTAPDPASSPERLRFAFCSCQQINDSYYIAHAAIGAEDLDYVVHYGDYIYVSDGGTITLDDYRGVYKRFKANSYLQDLHARYPMVVMWDDGEFVNGIDSTMEPVRFAAARRAWFEFMPMGRNPDEPDRTYRELGWGDLATFLMLDVRQYRSKAIDSNTPTGLLPTTDTNLPSGAAIFDPDRQVLGDAQKAWFKDRLKGTDATWRHVGHGYPFMALRLEDYDTPAARKDPPPNFHVNGGKYLSTEDWDGYWAERRELMDYIEAECIPNVIVSSGQVHIFFASPLRPDFDDLEDSQPVAFEVTCGSLTADPDPRSQYFPNLSKADAEKAIHSLEKAFLEINPQIDYIDLLNQGYGIITFTPGECRIDFRTIDTFDKDAVAATAKTFRIAAGEYPKTLACKAAPPPTTTTTSTTSTTQPGAGVAPADGAQPIGGSPTYTG